MRIYSDVVWNNVEAYTDVIRECNETYIAGGVYNSHIYVKHFCYDNIISNKNKSIITSIIKTGYTYWERLYHNKQDYIKEKEKLANYIY